MKKRCAWAQGDPVLEAYHDKEWGRPVYDDQILFELLTLEGAQAGLSWKTVLIKRENYRKRFCGFHIKKVALMRDADLEICLQNSGLIRNRLKIFSVRQNAWAVLQLQKEHGSFSKYLWDFVGGKPVLNRPKTLKDMPSQTSLSQLLSKDLKRRGFSFVGPTIMYAFMQASGLVNDHELACGWAP